LHGCDHKNINNLWKISNISTFRSILVLRNPQRESKN